MIYRSVFLSLRSRILLATLLLVTAAIAPLCIAAGEPGELEIPVMDPASSPVTCGTDGGSGGPGTDSSGYCTTPGAIGIKVTINPSSAVPLPTTTRPAVGINIPTTTPAPSVTIRINHTPAFVPPVTTTTAPVTTLTIQPVTPSLAVNRSPAVAAATTTPCRACTTNLPVFSKTIAPRATTARIATAQELAPKQGLVESVVSFIGSLFGQKPAPDPSSRQVFETSVRSINPAVFSTTLTAKDNASRFIEMEPNAMENLYNNNGIGTYSWKTSALTEGNVASAVWQLSLNDFPNDRKNWYNPPGMLGFGVMGKDQHEFTVNYTEYLPKPEEVDGHWSGKTSMLTFSRSEIEQLELQLAAQQPYNPSDPAQSYVNQIRTNLAASKQKIDLQLANPSAGQFSWSSAPAAMQNRQYTGNATQGDTAASVFANADMKKAVMREALTITLPTDQRIVYLRVVLLDADGNATSFSNTVPVTVGRKKIALVSPWSGWQKVPMVTPHSQTGGYIQELDGAFFNGKTYLVGRSDGRVWWGVLDPSGTFSGWTEIPGGQRTHRDIAVASFTSDECHPEASTGLIVVITGDDNRIWYNAMNMQGNWMGWTEVPGNITSEYGPTLNIATKGLYRHIILTVKKANTGQYLFNEPPIRESLKDVPGGYLVPNWGSWNALPTAPCFGTVPEGLPFVEEEVALADFYGNPEYTDNYMKQYRFVTACLQSEGSYQKGHVYYLNGTTNWTYNGGYSTSWSGWSEVPGGLSAVTGIRTSLWGDNLWIGAINPEGKISVSRIDALGAWLPWSTIPENFSQSTYVHMPALIDGDRFRIIGPVSDQLWVNTFQSLQFLFSKKDTPYTDWSGSSTSGEFTYCHKYYRAGGIPVPWRPGDVIASWAGKQNDGQLVAVQIAEMPFNETVFPNQSVTFDSLIRTQGAVRTWINPVSPEFAISGKPTYVDPVHLVPFAVSDYAANSNEALNLHARAIIISFTDKPGELKGYITPTSHFLYSPKAELIACDPPVEHPIDVYVPDVTIMEYNTIHYPDFSNGPTTCNVISTKQDKALFGGEPICPAIGTKQNFCREDKGILDYITDFFGDLIDFLESVVNFLSRVWDSLKNACVSLIANFIPGCSSSGWCTGVISGCLDTGLTALGIPPSIPNFSELQNMGVEYLAASIGESVGVSPELVKPGLDKMKGAIEEQYTQSGDLCGWKPDPAFQGRPAYMNITLTNNQGRWIPGGTIYVRDVFTDSRGLQQSVFRTSQPGIPYPAMKPGVSFTVPVILERTVSNTTIMGCWRKQADGSLKEWTCDGNDGSLNLYDWDKGYGEPHPMTVEAVPDTYVNIANLEAQLGMKNVGNSSGYQRIGINACPETFYVEYKYHGRQYDSFMLDAKADWHR